MRAGQDIFLYYTQTSWRTSVDKPKKSSSQGGFIEWRLLYLHYGNSNLTAIFGSHIWKSEDFFAEFLHRKRRALAKWRSHKFNQGEGHIPDLAVRCLNVPHWPFLYTFITISLRVRWVMTSLVDVRAGLGIPLVHVSQTYAHLKPRKTHWMEKSGIGIWIIKYGTDYHAKVIFTDFQGHRQFSRRFQSHKKHFLFLTVKPQEDSALPSFFS